MKPNSDGTRLVLMISSIVLLVILQVLWLMSSYENAFITLRRETSTILRSSVFALRDSLFIKNIRPVKDGNPADSVVRELDSVVVGIANRDTILSHREVRADGSSFQIYVSSGRMDSVAQYLTPLASTMQHLRTRPNFVIRIGDDTLSQGALNKVYMRSLHESGMDLHFIIKRFMLPPPDISLKRRISLTDDGDMVTHGQRGLFRDTLYTDHVRLNPLNSYGASFPGIRKSVVRAIAPQIFFSLFLTFITTTSFLIMYRNLQAQQRLMDMKNNFISNVTHELKTPVATVSVALEALKDFNALENPERAREYLSIAQNELNRLTLMTDKILKASSFESQGVSFIPEPVYLDQVAGHVISSMKLAFEKKRISVHYLPSGSDFRVQGSELHLTNVLFNLVDNATKYSPDHSSIEISLKSLSTTVEIAVIDHGIGIAKEYQQKIFEKFFRVPTGDVQNTKGYGLGLNYVAEVIKIHRGEIRLVSSPAEGSRFIVSLPRLHAAN